MRQINLCRSNRLNLIEDCELRHRKKNLKAEAIIKPVLRLGERTKDVQLAVKFRELANVKG
jgi:hypothetical protein